jgi:phage/plasmid-associated DNA primase
LNVIFDGEMTYIKDSSMEKSLIAGEPRHIRLLWESGTTRVQTNALFIEALNEEPKARDKTSALQKRLVRYRFPNTYKMDLEFSAKMTSDRYLGAFLSLLIDHYVKPSELATKLKPTASALELQFEQTFLTAPVLQYLAHVMDSDPKFPEKLAQGQVSVEAFVNSYQPWADSQHLDKRSDAEVKALLKQSFDLKWKTRRVGPEKKPTNTHMIVGVKQDTQMAIDQMRGETIGTEHLTEEVVGD